MRTALNLLRITACLALCNTVALAQYPVQNTGRMFDYNSQIGGTPYGAARPASALLGNLSAAGNLRGGLSFQGYSPITDPTAFRAPVGSSALSSFLRDSVSASDSYAGSYFDARQAFFDPSRTAATGSLLQRSGQYGGFSSTARSYTTSGAISGGPVLPSSPVIPTLNGVNRASPNDPRLTSNAAAQSPLDTRAYISPNSELYSSIFGVGRAALPKPPGLPILEKSVAETAESKALALGDISKPDATKGQSPLDWRISPARPMPLDKPLDQLVKSDAQSVLAGRGIGPNPTVPGRTQPDLGRGEQPAPPIVTYNAQPGRDMFTDLRLALELQRNPNPSWMREVFGRPAAPRGTSPADVDPAGFADRVLSAPIRSFARPNQDPVNDELAKAEAALHGEDYYEAAAHYERAIRLDPINPLPMIGKGHALISAGEYVSGAVYLLRGLERFPEVARLNIDLRSLMGGGEIVDIRRAEIMRLLERGEDSRLRFLLGYLEYYSGQQASGMQNLEKAAETAEPGSLILRFPALLRSGNSPQKSAPAHSAPAD